MTVKEITKQESDMVRLIFWKKTITLVSVWKMSWQGPGLDHARARFGCIPGNTPYSISVHDNTCVWGMPRFQLCEVLLREQGVSAVFLNHHQSAQTPPWDMDQTTKSLGRIFSSKCRSDTQVSLTTWHEDWVKKCTAKSFDMHIGLKTWWW